MLCDIDIGVEGGVTVFCDQMVIAALLVFHSWNLAIAFFPPDHGLTGFVGMDLDIASCSILSRPVLFRSPSSIEAMNGSSLLRCLSASSSPTEHI